MEQLSNYIIIMSVFNCVCCIWFDCWLLSKSGQFALKWPQTKMRLNWNRIFSVSLGHKYINKGSIYFRVKTNYIDLVVRLCWDKRKTSLDRVGHMECRFLKGRGFPVAAINGGSGCFGLIVLHIIMYVRVVVHVQ